MCAGFFLFLAAKVISQPCAEFCCMLGDMELSSEYGHRFEVFYQQRLRSIYDIRWSDRVNNAQVRNLVLSAGFNNLLS